MRPSPFAGTGEIAGITWFDNFSILLKRDQHVQLVCHAISTIMPMAPVQLQELDDEAEGAATLKVAGS